MQVFVNTLLASSFKQGLEVGEWQIDVESQDGPVLEQVQVHVEDRDDVPALLWPQIY